MRMTGGGRRFRFRAAVVVGDKKGKIGFGIAKGKDVSQAVEKATRIAKKNIVKVPIKEGTIPHQVEAKFGAARIILKPQMKPKHKLKKKKRVGRGGKRGTYSGKGIKGQKSRAGRKMVPVIRELIKKYPKLRG